MVGKYYNETEALMFVFQVPFRDHERETSLRNSFAYKIYQTQSVKGISISNLRDMLDIWDHYRSSRKEFKFGHLHARTWEESLSKELENEIIHEVSRWFDLTRWKVSRDPLTDPEYEGLFI